jgi:hypothetical protein
VNRPNYDYLQLKANISSPSVLKKRVLERCKEIDMKLMAEDVAPFLFNAADAKRVTYFPEYLQQIKLD